MGAAGQPHQLPAHPAQGTLLLTSRRVAECVPLQYHEDLRRLAFDLSPAIPVSAAAVVAPQPMPLPAPAAVAVDSAPAAVAVDSAAQQSHSQSHAASAAAAAMDTDHDIVVKTEPGTEPHPAG